jgi:hypothetical protein
LHSIEIKQNRHFWLDLGTKANWGFQEKGGFVGVGYRWRLFGTDLRIAYVQTKYQSIRSFNDSNNNTGTGYAPLGSNQEINRLRSPDDSWKLFWVEPGLSVEGQMFPESLPRLSERARVGIAIGNFQDSVNSITFTATLITFETALIYQLFEDRPWAVSGAIAWNTGNATSTSKEFTLVSDRNLPINWIDTSLGLMYNF